MELLGYVVAIVAGLKAIEWIFEKIIKFGNKSQKVEVNSQEIIKYKDKNDAEIDKIKEDLAKAHNYAQKSLDDIRKEILDTINKDRNEYLKGIEDVKASITEMSSAYQQTVAVIELKIDNLEKSNTEHLTQLKKAQDKHNNLMERTFICEKEISVLQNRESVSEHRLNDLERK